MKWNFEEKAICQFLKKKTKKHNTNSFIFIAKVCLLLFASFMVILLLAIAMIDKTV